MESNPIGKDARTIGVNIDSKMADELATRAATMRISTAKYCKIVLQQWMDSGETLNLGEK